MNFVKTTMDILWMNHQEFLLRQVPTLDEWRRDNYNNFEELEEDRIQANGN